MKKTLLLFGASALLLSSCDTSSQDSYQTIPYEEYNLIVDTQDMEAPAQASYGSYVVKFIMSKNVIDIKSSDIIINNQKRSFETDTMKLRSKVFNVEGLGMAENYMFSKSGPTSVGSPASNLNGTLVWYYVPSGTSILSPDYTVTVGQRLDLSYTLNDRYSVQTFWPTAFYRGQTVAVEGAESYSSKSSDYLTQIDFEKKTASIYVYNAELSADQDKNFPKVIRFEDIPVVFNHEGFTITSATPKTTVLGKKDNQTAMVDSVGFAATDFTLELTSKDMTDINIYYKLNGKSVNFRGCSILKAN